MASLRKQELTEEQRGVMISSGMLGQRKSAKLTMTLALRKQRLGLALTEAEDDLLHRGVRKHANNTEIMVADALPELPRNNKQAKQVASEAAPASEADAQPAETKPEPKTPKAKGSFSFTISIPDKLKAKPKEESDVESVTSDRTPSPVPEPVPDLNFADVTASVKEKYRSQHAEGAAPWGGKSKFYVRVKRHHKVQLARQELPVCRMEQEVGHMEQGPRLGGLYST